MTPCDKRQCARNRAALKRAALLVARLRERPDAEHAMRCVTFFAEVEEFMRQWLYGG